MTITFIPKPIRRGVFVLYALALVTATHWPGLAIQSPGFSRLDLVIHAVSFAAWTVLCTACAFFGPATGRRNLARSIPLALVYALADEFTQAIPALHRTLDPLDLAANGVGILLASIGLALWTRADHPQPTTDN